MTNEVQLQNVQIHLGLETMGLRLVAEDANERVYEGVAIREGIYIPGVGNPMQLRIRIRADVLKAIAPTWKGKKVDMEHEQDIENEVGVIIDSYYVPDVKGIRQQLKLQPTRPKFTSAVGFIEGRLSVGLVPELSVEFENMVLRNADPREKAFFDLDLIGATGAGTALVTRGACGARDGCGIGLSFADPLNANSNPSNPADTVTALRDSQMPCDQNCVTKHAELMTAKGKADEARDLALKARDEAVEAKKLADGKLADAEKTVTGLKSDLDAKKVELGAATTTIQGYKDAEKTALLEALSLAAPKTADLKAVLGLEAKQDLKEATIPQIEVALKAFKAFGSKPASGENGGGRRTVPTSRDGSPLDVQKFLDAKRESMGLSKPDDKGAVKSNLPRSMQRNTDRLLPSRGAN